MGPSASTNLPFSDQSALYCWTDNFIHTIVETGVVAAGGEVDADSADSEEEKAVGAVGYEDDEGGWMEVGWKQRQLV
jgi:hypothetical protein